MRTACWAETGEPKAKRTSGRIRRRIERPSGLLLGRRRLAEGRHAFDAILEGFGTFRRQGLGPIEGAVDVAFPDLARQVVDELDAVAVGVVDVEAMGHA